MVPSLNVLELIRRREPFGYISDQFEDENDDEDVLAPAEYYATNEVVMRMDFLNFLMDYLPFLIRLMSFKKQIFIFVY